MTMNAIPSRNPTNDGSLVGAFRVALSKFLQGVDDMLPCVVIAYDRRKNTATVQPLISMVTTLGEIVPRAQIASVQVFQIGGGGFTLNFPMKPGDLGWIKANDRDISLFKKALKFVAPNTARKHSFEDGVLIPDEMMKDVIINDEDLENALFQNNDGTVRIALWPSQIKITTPNMAIGDTEGYSPAASAILDLQSTTKGFGFPAMTTGQKDAIASPRPGYAVFDTTLDGISVYTAGGGWTP